MKKSMLLLIVFLLLLSIPVAAQDSELPWWNNRVFYEVFVRSFYDSDGDGIGDIQGLISKLDYLNDGDPTTTDDLGVTGLWLMPINQSPSYHGYDVVDYYDIESDYGTMDDFRQLMEEARKRDMAVIIDLVMNHTSIEHEWFIESQEDGSEYEDWYLWEDEAPRYVGPWGQRVWHPRGDEHYYGIFWEGMPDLNYRNPDVTAEMYNIIDFWLTDVGVDGFRLDAVRHLIEDEDIQENTPETHEWLQAYHDYVDSVNPDALSVGEIWTESANIAPYIPNEVDIAFEFDLGEAMLASANIGSQIAVKNQQEEVLEIYPHGQYATFLTNHDQNRVRSMVKDDAAAKIAASMLLTNPGVPFIYYGEEIGMTGMKPDERIRTPMQWESVETGGFTTGTPWQRLSNDYEDRSVAAQEEVEGSLLNHYRGLLHARNNHPALQIGDFTLVDSDNTHIYSFIRSTGDQTVLVIINLDNEDVSDYVLIPEEGTIAGEATVIYSDSINAEITQPNGEGYKPLETIPAQSTLILEMQ